VAAPPGVGVVAVVFADDRSIRPLGVDADRAHVDEAANAVLEGGLDQPLRPQHVDLEEIDPAPARLDLAGAVVDHVHALHGPLQRRPLAEVAGHDVNAESPDAGPRLLAAPDHRPLVALEGEALDELATEKSRSSRDEGLHRACPFPRPPALGPVRPICSQTVSSTRTTSRPASPSTGAGRPSAMLR